MGWKAGDGFYPNQTDSESNEPIFKLPDTGMDRPFIVQSDTSNKIPVACLLQQHDGIKHPVM